jgi:hypothetical protein
VIIPPQWTGPAGAWIEIIEGCGVDVEDFGWPPDPGGPRFAYLGCAPPGALSWEQVIREWCDAGGARGEGVEGEWAKTYLTADDARRFLAVAFGILDPRTVALGQRLDPRHCYIVSSGGPDADGLWRDVGGV